MMNPIHAKVHYTTREVHQKGISCSQNYFISQPCGAKAGGGINHPGCSATECEEHCANDRVCTHFLAFEHWGGCQLFSGCQQAQQTRFDRSGVTKEIVRDKKCDNSCYNNTSPWSVKCAWQSALCATCNECNCIDHKFCRENIKDESSAFLMCSMFLGTGYIANYREYNKGNRRDPSGNKCRYRCSKYGYNTLPKAECPSLCGEYGRDCVSSLDDTMVSSHAKAIKSTLYYKTCWETHYFQLTSRTNDICNNNPDQNLTAITVNITQTPVSKVVEVCKAHCVENDQCVHLIIDRINHVCKLYKSCRDRKVTSEWDKGRYDHYFLMCPRRGGCDWRYQTVGLYQNTTQAKLAMTMRIARAPWAPFFPVQKTPTIWATFHNKKSCSIKNKRNFTGKIVLFEGQEVSETGPTFSYLNYTDPVTKIVTKPAPNFCDFSDQIMEAQYAGAKAAFIVLTRKFTLTIFDEMGNSHLQFRDNSPEKRPNIPAGILIYEYWHGFKQNQYGDMAIGCAIDFGLSQCVPVNFPNVKTGYIFCGCVLPKEIKRYNDASQTITLDPCWQMDENDPRYCVLDVKHCENYEHHMKKIKKPCGAWCSGITGCEQAHCTGCAHCHEETLIDQGTTAILENTYLKSKFEETGAANDYFRKDTPETCNNILEKHKIFMQNGYGRTKQKCADFCVGNPQCMYFSFSPSDQLQHNCLLHASCNLLIMATEPSRYKYSIFRMEREYTNCYLANNMPAEYRCENLYEHCTPGKCKCTFSKCSLEGDKSQKIGTWVITRSLDDETTVDYVKGYQDEKFGMRCLEDKWCRKNNDVCGTTKVSSLVKIFKGNQVAPVDGSGWHACTEEYKNAIKSTTITTNWTKPIEGHWTVQRKFGRSIRTDSFIGYDTDVFSIICMDDPYCSTAHNTQGAMLVDQYFNVVGPKFMCCQHMTTVDGIIIKKNFKPKNQKCWKRHNKGKKCGSTKGFVLDEWGSINRDSFKSKSKCLERKKDIDRQCGVNAEICYAATAKECRESCRDAVKGEKCYSQVTWAMKKGFPNHPEWYGPLNSTSSFQDFQNFFHQHPTLGKNGNNCRRPCLKQRETPRTMKQWNVISKNTKSNCAPHERMVLGRRGWNNLGRKNSLAECAQSCFDAARCKFAAFRRNGKGQCTGFKSCKRKRNTRNVFDLVEMISRDRKLENSRSGQVPMQKTENENSGEDVNTPNFHEY